MPFAAAISGGASIIGSLFGKKSAKSAADTQAHWAEAVAKSIQEASGKAQQGMTDATTAAQTNMRDAITQGNQVYSDVYGNQVANLNPYLQAGATAATNLNAALQPGGELAQKFSFGAGDFQADPGYQFTLAEGLKALDRSAAARGGALGGAALKGAARYATGLADTTFQNAYNRAANTFQLNRSTMLQALGLGLGAGQTATGQYNQAGQWYGGGTNQNIMNGAQYIGNAGITGAQYSGNIGMEGALRAGDAYLQGANAKAAGQVASGNSWTNMANGLANAGMSLFKPAASNGVWSEVPTGSDPGNLYGAGGYYSTMPAPPAPNFLIPPTVH